MPAGRPAPTRVLMGLPACLARVAGWLQPLSSVNPDFTSFIPRKGDESKVDIFVHFEVRCAALALHVAACSV